MMGAITRQKQPSSLVEQLFRLIRHMLVNVHCQILRSTWFVINYTDLRCGQIAGSTFMKSDFGFGAPMALGLPAASV